METLARTSLLRIGDVDLHWAELGSGRPLVLLHGLSDSHGTWGRVGPALAAKRRVLMLDLPGFGLSGRPDASYALAWHAELVASWIEALGLDEIDLVGHSFGGGVAQRLLLTRRARVRRLALVAAGGLGPEVGFAIRLCSIPGMVERFGQPFMSAGTRFGMHAASNGAFDARDIDTLSWMNARPGTSRALARTVRDVVDIGGQRIHFLDHAGELGELPPTALYWGDRDRVIPFAHATDVASRFDGMSLTRFDGCGHFPHRERPAEFIRALEDFVDAPSAERPRARRSSSIAVPRPRPKSLLRRALDRLGKLFCRRDRTRRARAPKPSCAPVLASS